MSDATAPPMLRQVIDGAAAINTLSVSPSNEGTRTMLVELLRAIRSDAPTRRLVLICSRANRPLFETLGFDLIEVGTGRGRWWTLRRIWHDQFTAPRIAQRLGMVLVTAAGVPALRCRAPQIALVSYHLALPSCRAAAGDARPDLLHRAYYGLPFRIALRRCDIVLGISRHLAQGLCDELRIDRARVEPMPLGVATPHDVDSRAQREPTLLFVGTLYNYKDVSVAIRAFALARGQLPPRARLVIAGKDPDGSQIERLARVIARSDVNDSVELLGPVSGDELDRLYCTSAALILPSRCEGFGLPVAEAMAHATPVVVADATSLPEVAGAGGICAAPGDVESFAKAIVLLLTDKNAHRIFSEQALAQAKSLNWAATAGVMLRAIDRLDT